MSKTAPKPAQELILARVLYEREWAYERRIVDGLPWQAIRSLGVRPDELGGINRNLGVGTLKGMVAEHMAEQGVMHGTREERIERRQLELDALALMARSSLARAAESGALDVHAAKILLDARAAEAKMHGDDAALRIEADVTTHDAVSAELDALLARAGREPIAERP